MRFRPMRTWGVVATVVLVAVGGCDIQADPPPVSATLSVDAEATADEAFAVDVSGLGATQAVTVVVSATDGKQVRWESRITAAADTRGALQLGSSAGRATELSWRMRPSGTDSEPRAFFWPSAVDFRVVVEDQDGRRLASATQRRRLQARPSTDRPLTLAAEGLDAR
jgi:hypothetical protein